MKLRNRIPKIDGVGAHREVTVETTYERVAPHMRRVGITRLSDITGLDRIGIPVWNTICPSSHDMISVYNGKGGTDLAAKTSAIMEAVERFAAALPMRPEEVASVNELRAAGRTIVDPADVNLEQFHVFGADTPISWVTGHDVSRDEEVLVPLYLAGYYSRYHEVPSHRLGTTNGIASGNSVEEAICHALCELIERDDWTMADLIGNRLSRLVGRGTFGAATGPTLRWLHERHRNVDLDTLPPSAQRYVRMYRDAGLEVSLKDLSSETGVCTVLALVAENIANTFSQSHMGMGTHPDAETAVCRALCEVAQSRAVDINALREDITLPGEEVEKFFFHVRRSGHVNKESWAFKTSENLIGFDELPHHPSDDIVADIDLMLGRLRERGLDRVIVVDLSPPGIPVSVVRVIIPGIESWIIDRTKLGPRAVRLWDDTLDTIKRACDKANEPVREGV
jgi:ribosomal protein S12 methylthiotransferase accessory factor